MTVVFPVSLLRERLRTRLEIPQNEARAEKEEGAKEEGGEGGVDVGVMSVGGGGGGKGVGGRREGEG